MLTGPAHATPHAAPSGPSPRHMPKPELIPISSLQLDLINPRLPEGVDSQHEAIKAIAELQREKLVNLAKHIVDHGGVNPADPLMVIPAEGAGAKKRYIVVEGNRRLTALRLLNEPGLADGVFKDAALTRRLNALSRRFHAAPIRRVLCVEFKDRKEANPWIELRHQGLGAGAGIAPWGSVEVQRFTTRSGGRPAPELQVMDYVRASGALDADTTAKLGVGFKLSTLKRVVNNARARELLGIERTRGEVRTRYDDGGVLRALARVVGDIAHNRQTSRTLHTSEQIEEYVKGLGRDLPDRTKPLGEPRPLGTPPGTTAASATGSGAGAASTRKQPRPPGSSRATLAPSAPALVIGHSRINNVYHELRKLRVEDYPNAASVLLRVFLELSTDEYIDQYLLMSDADKRNKSLAFRMKAVVGHLRGAGRIDGAKADAIERAVDANAVVAASVPTFNMYVHNQNHSPLPSDLRTTWDNYEPYLLALWA